MVVPGGVTVSYERGTPVVLETHPPPGMVPAPPTPNTACVITRPEHLASQTGKNRDWQDPGPHLLLPVLVPPPPPPPPLVRLVWGLGLRAHGLGFRVQDI
jgi:hypothetical protein